MEFVKQLPILNRRVLVFVITFFQLFIKPEVVQVTKMTPSNLGKCPSFSLSSVLQEAMLIGSSAGTRPKPVADD